MSGITNRLFGQHCDWFIAQDNRHCCSSILNYLRSLFQNWIMTDEMLDHNLSKLTAKNISWWKPDVQKVKLTPERIAKISEQALQILAPDTVLNQFSAKQLEAYFIKTDMSFRRFEENKEALGIRDIETFVLEKIASNKEISNEFIQKLSVDQLLKLQRHILSCTQATQKNFFKQVATLNMNDPSLWIDLKKCEFSWDQEGDIKEALIKVINANSRNQNLISCFSEFIEQNRLSINNETKSLRASNLIQNSNGPTLLGYLGDDSLHSHLLFWEKISQHTDLGRLTDGQKQALANALIKDLPSTNMQERIKETRERLQNIRLGNLVKDYYWLSSLDPVVIQALDKAIVNFDVVVEITSRSTSSQDFPPLLNQLSFQQLCNIIFIYSSDTYKDNQNLQTNLANLRNHLINQLSKDNIEELSKELARGLLKNLGDALNPMRETDDQPSELEVILTKAGFGDLDPNQGYFFCANDDWEKNKKGYSQALMRFVSAQQFYIDVFSQESHKKLTDFEWIKELAPVTLRSFGSKVVNHHVLDGILNRQSQLNGRMISSRKDKKVQFSENMSSSLKTGKKRVPYLLDRFSNQQLIELLALLGTHEKLYSGEAALLIKYSKPKIAACIDKLTQEQARSLLKVPGLFDYELTYNDEDSCIVSSNLEKVLVKAGFGSIDPSNSFFFCFAEGAQNIIASQYPNLQDFLDIQTSLKTIDGWEGENLVGGIPDNFRLVSVIQLFFLKKIIEKQVFYEANAQTQVVYDSIDWDAVCDGGMGKPNEALKFLIQQISKNPTLINRFGPGLLQSKIFLAHIDPTALKSIKSEFFHNNFDLFTTLYSHNPSYFKQFVVDFFNNTIQQFSEKNSEENFQHLCAIILKKLNLEISMTQGKETLLEYMRTISEAPEITKDLIPALQRAVIQETLTKKNLNIPDIEAIFDYIEARNEEIDTFFKSNPDAQIGPMPRSETGLSRSILITREGDPILLLNRKKEGDIVIGTGTSREVKTALNLKTNTFLATTGLPLSNQAVIESVNDEMMYMKTLQKVPNTIRLKGAIQTQKGNQVKQRLLMELYDGSLWDLRETFKNLDLKQQISIFRDLTLALKGIHDKGMIHRDIKINNMLYRHKEDGNIEVAICDYDHAIYKTETRPLSVPGTIVFAAPEYQDLALNFAQAMLNQDSDLIRKYGQALTRTVQEPADVWALACAFYELHTSSQHPAGTIGMWLQSQDPSLAQDYWRYVKEVCSRIQTFTIDNFSALDRQDRLYLMFEGMLQKDPNQRWTLDKVLAFLEETLNSTP